MITLSVLIDAQMIFCGNYHTELGQLHNHQSKLDWATWFAIDLPNWAYSTKSKISSNPLSDLNPYQYSGTTVKAPRHCTLLYSKRPIVLSSIDSAFLNPYSWDLIPPPFSRFLFPIASSSGSRLNTQLNPSMLSSMPLPSTRYSALHVRAS